MFEFERVVCVSLDRRPDRWRKFLNSLPEDWPFGTVEKYSAIDGHRVPAANWWTAGGGAWGCYKSHLNIIEDCLNRCVRSCLFLEDDAICCDHFGKRTKEFFSELPEDWCMIYLGGEHLFSNQCPPTRISSNVLVPFNVNRTHAFAIRGSEMMRWIYQHLNQVKTWRYKHHIDHHLGRAHQLREKRIYCPTEWLIGQSEGKSDISSKYFDTRFYAHKVRRM